MTSVGRTVLYAVGAALVLGGVGIGLVQGGIMPNPFAPKSPSGLVQVVNWPQTFTQAKSALIQLSIIAIEHQNTTLEANAHAEAQAIRSAYPSAGPAGGYTPPQLVQMGYLPSSYLTASGS